MSKSNIIFIIAQLYPPTRHTTVYLLESSGLPLPGTYTTTISGQCSERGNCPLAARLRWGRTKKYPLYIQRIYKGQGFIQAKKNLAPKGLSILQRYFAIYFFKKQAYTSNCYA